MPGLSTAPRHIRLTGGMRAGDLAVMRDHHDGQYQTPRPHPVEPVLEHADAVRGHPRSASYVRESHGVHRRRDLGDDLAAALHAWQLLMPNHGSFTGLTSAAVRKWWLPPIPKGTPVNLLTNLNILPDDQTTRERLAHDRKLLELLVKIKRDLKALPANATDEQARKVFANLVGPMLALSKCPDFVVNRGHYFGTDLFKEEPGLSDADKRALIEFLKTL